MRAGGCRGHGAQRAPGMWALHHTDTTPPAELCEVALPGEPGDSVVHPWVAMVSPNYSSSARMAWVRGEAARQGAGGGLCSSARGAATWASTAHLGHGRDGPAVAVCGGTDTGVTQQPYVGAQAELSRAPRSGLSPGGSEVWDCVCMQTGALPRSHCPRVLSATGRCSLLHGEDFAPAHSPASRW